MREKRERERERKRKRERERERKREREKKIGGERKKGKEGGMSSRETVKAVSCYQFSLV